MRSLLPFAPILAAQGVLPLRDSFRIEKCSDSNESLAFRIYWTAGILFRHAARIPTMSSVFFAACVRFLRMFLVTVSSCIRLNP